MCLCDLYVAFVTSAKIAVSPNKAVVSSLEPVSAAFINAAIVAMPVPQHAKMHAYLDMFACLL